MPSVNHQIATFFHLSSKLSQAAELAADNDGRVDLQKVPADLRATLKAVGGDAFTVSSVNQALDASLKLIDSFDVGKHGGRGVPATGGCGSRTGAEERIAEFRDAHGTASKPQSAFTSFLATVTGRRQTASNLVLDTEERAKLESTGTPAAKALLAHLDAQAGQASPHAKHFPDRAKLKVTTAVSATQPLTARLHAEAGATKDLAAIMVKNLDTGAWSTNAVRADGSFDVDLGKVGGGGAEQPKYAVWFETTAGGRFSAGELTGFWLSNDTRPIAHHLDGDSPLRG